MSANGIGGAVAAQIITPIINNGETFGYRPCFWLFSGILVIVIVSYQFVLRSANKDKTAILAAETA